MALRQYPNGYGLKEAAPECREVEQVDCPCCGGSGEHAFGKGMDADAVECSACKGHGWFLVLTPG